MKRNAIPDLWPKSTPTVGKVGPVAILEAQAKFLGARCENMVRGAVEIHGSEGLGFRYTFWIETPALNFHRDRLMFVDHSRGNYPLTVRLYLEKDDAGKPVETVVEAHNEEDFLKVVREAFAHKNTYRLIQHLLDASLRSKTVETAYPRTGRTPGNIKDGHDVLDGKRKIGLGSVLP